MNTSNSDPVAWHPANGRGQSGQSGRSVGGRGRRTLGDATVVDLATERAIRLLAQAGMVPASALSRRHGTVR